MHADRLARGKNLLHKVDVGSLGDAQACRTGDGAAQRGVFPNQRARIPHQFNRFFAYLGKVALIMLVDDLSIAHNDDFDCR